MCVCVWVRACVRACVRVVFGCVWFGCFALFCCLFVVVVVVVVVVFNL